MTDVEILHKSRVNVLARGKRYGRFWFLKGLRKELIDSGPLLRRHQKEFEIHSRLLHRGVVKVAGFEEIDSLGTCIVEEWVVGRNLSDLLKERNLDKRERRRILREIIEAVVYIHGRGVVHRDLKPTNIMVRDEGGDVVIIDFGLADTSDYAELKQGAGTAGYISPEQQSGHGAKATDDIYSLGVIMSELCPEYKRIAGRCTGPLERRPHDCGELLRSITRHDRRPKMFCGIAVGAALIGVVIAAGFHFYHLHSVATDVNYRAAAMHGEARGAETRLHRMGDSLKGMAGTVRSSESEIESAALYEERLRRAYEDMRNRMDGEMDDFERRILPMFDMYDQCFWDSIESLEMRLQKICDTAYDAERYPELKREDVTALYDTMSGYCWTTSSIRQHDWREKLGLPPGKRSGFR